MIDAPLEFDAEFYLLQYPDIKQSGRDPHEHYLHHGRAEGRFGSAEERARVVAEAGNAADFDPEFYLANNPDVRASGVDPLEHYLRAGHAEGRLGKAAPPEQPAEPEYAFDEEFYLRQYADVRVSGGDPYQHFIHFGRAEGRVGTPSEQPSEPEYAFDEEFYLRQYADVRISGGDPYQHFIHFGRAEGRVGTPSEQPSEPEYEFDEEFYLRQYADVRLSGVDPYQHYRLFGRAEGRRGTPPDPGAEPSGTDSSDEFDGDPSEFDELFYLKHYPDVGRSGMQPYRHFMLYGRVEGRLGAQPALKKVPGAVAFDASKETVLVVSHEASVTGAPILSINLVRGLQQKYNVVALLMGGGPLVGTFEEACVLVVGPIFQRHSAALAKDAVAQLVEMHDVKFAIVNSIECAQILEPLARASIPAITLIHEFASYTRPRSAFKTAFFWSSEVVFSTQLTYQDVIRQNPQLRSRACRFVPQGRCVLLADAVDAKTHEREMSRIHAALRPAGSAGDMLVVIGIGSVHIRKGVEFFIDCAAKVLRAGTQRPVRFVWIGNGFDPDDDLSYSVYLADQIQRSGLQQHLHFMETTPLVEEIYRLSDVLLLTSRLDPLPGVAIEAMSHSMPVVCFDRTTGIADVLIQHGMADECVVPYLDTAAMAARVIDFAASREHCEQVGRQLLPIAEDYFDMERYIRELEALALAAVPTVAQELQLAQDIHGTTRSRHDFLSSAPPPFDEVEIIRWKYVRPWNAGFDRRKVFPGFHPGVYQELRGDGATSDPVLAYLAAGSPDGPWLHEVISSDEAPLAVPAGLRVALHLHVFYPELLPDMLERLGRNALRPDLYISVPNETARERVQGILQAFATGAVLEVVPNRGRDIGPLLTGFGPRLIEGYDIIGHLHTKKTADVADVTMGETWRTFLFENLLGGKAAMADIIVGRMAADPAIGLVFPDEPNLLDWGSNRPHAQALCGALGLSGELPEQFEFPVGTMFWARPEALRPLFELALEWNDYPVEPLPYDGSMLHALERLLPLVVAQQSFTSVLTNVEGVTR